MINPVLELASANLLMVASYSCPWGVVVRSSSEVLLDPATGDGLATRLTSLATGEQVTSTIGPSIVSKPQLPSQGVLTDMQTESRVKRVTR